MSKLTIEVEDPTRASPPEASVHVLQWRPVSSTKSQLVDVASGTPDARGIFSVSLPHGQYTVYVASPGLASRIVDINVPRGRERTYTFNLPVSTGDGTEIESTVP
jgi:hypothetical protein